METSACAVLKPARRSTEMMPFFPSIETGLSRSRATQAAEGAKAHGPCVTGDYQAPR